MKENWKEIQPKDAFKILVNRPLSDQEKEFLTFVYQPIIGAKAFSLYLTLLSEIEGSGFSDSLFHKDLILLLDLSIQQITKERKKLEGIGLVTTFVKEDQKLGAVFVYRLNPPESVEKFFKDEILTLTLLNRVGQVKFDQLFQRFQPKYFSLAGYEDISAGYQEVYSFNETQLISENTRLEGIREAFQDPRPREKLTAGGTFDWSFFLEILKRFGLSIPQDNVFKEEVEVFSGLYGIDEIQMADFTKDSFDYQNNRPDLRELKKLLQRYFNESRKQQPVQIKRNETAELSEEQQRSYRFNSLKSEGFTAADVELIMESETMPPMTYLSSLKKATGGFVTAQERYIVEYLAKNSGLPNSVINLLLHYVLFIQKQSTLKSDYVYTIANDWAKQEVFSPEKAITYVREKQKNRKQPKGRKNYNTKPAIRQEKLPDWVDNPVKEDKLSKEEQEQLDQEFEKYLRRRGDN